MADTSQAAARAAAIAAGNSAADVDAFIAKEGGARASAQRITSAFNVAGSVGTNDLSAFHAQKNTAAGTDASGRGTYLSGAMSAGDNAAAGGGGGGTGTGGGGGGTVPDDPVTTGSEAMGASAFGGLAAAAPVQESDVGNTAGLGFRQNLGSRLYPQNSAALAGLQRAY